MPSFVNRVRLLIAAAAAMGLVQTANAVTDVAYAWGWNGYYQIGDGTATSRPTPTSVSGLASNVSAVGGGEFHSLAVLSDGTVRAWGRNDGGMLGIGQITSPQGVTQVPGLFNVTAVAGGNSHSLALLSDGTVRGWGGNLFGQVGDGTSQNNRYSPVPVVGLTNVSSVAAGLGHSLALLSDGTVRAWGWNVNGQVGDGTTTNSPSPVPVSGLSAVSSVAAGDSHSLALLSDGTVRTWGNNSDGELGDGTMTNRAVPVVVSGLANVRSIAGGLSHSLAALSDGTVRAWGSNEFGQLGDGTMTNRLVPVMVAGLSNIVDVEGLSHSSFALSADGRLWCWGTGVGDPMSRLVPTEIHAPAGLRFDSIAGEAGGDHILALLSPVPAPSAAVLLGFGGLVVSHRRRYCGGNPAV